MIRPAAEMLARGIDSRFVPPSSNATGVVGHSGANAEGSGRNGGGAETRWVLRNGALCIGTGREALQSGAKAGRGSKGGGARRPQTSAQRRHTDTDLSPYRNTKAARPTSAVGPLRRGMAGMSIGASASKAGASLAARHGTGRLGDEAIESYVAALLERASVGHMKRATVSAAWGGAVRDALRRTARE